MRNFHLRGKVVIDTDICNVLNAILTKTIQCDEVEFLGKVEKIGTQIVFC